MRGAKPGRQQAAQKLYRKGLELQQRGAIAEAAAAYEKARGVAPDHYAILTNLGVCLGLLGRHRAGLKHLERAAALRPGDPVILGALGAALVQTGQAEAALAPLEAALARGSGNREAALFYGLALERLGRAAEALRAVQRAAAGAPPYAAALRELARMHGADRRRQEEAETAERAYAADPSWPEPNIRAYFARQALLDWDRLRALDTDDVLARCRADKTPLGRPQAYLGDPFALLARTEDRALHLKAGARRAAWLARVHGAPSSPEPPPAQRPSRPPARPLDGPPLKVGYLSSDFRDHPVMHVLAGVIRAHDPSRVEIHAYAHGPTPPAEDPYRLLVEQRSARLQDLDGLSTAEAADRIRADGLDLLIDLNGYTAGSRIEILAFRPAPIQAAYLGYPGTTGAPFVDYAIVDEGVAPPEHAAEFSEILAYHPVCYLPVDPAQPIAATPSTRSDWGLPETGAVFCSFNQPYKIDPTRFSTWMRVLSALEDSVLWLAAMDETLQARLRAQAAARGVSGDRIVFAERVEKELHFERLRHATAAFDTRLYNGHTTTTDALLAGVPVIATEGRHFAARVAATVLRRAGLAELVAADEDAYEALALELVRDADRRAAVEARIAEARATAPLFDPVRQARGLEALYHAMAERGPAATASRSPIRLAAHDI